MTKTKHHHNEVIHGINEATGMLGDFGDALMQPLVGDGKEHHKKHRD